MTDDPRSRAGWVLVAALALLVVAMAWLARSQEGRGAIVLCDAALKRGDRVEAIIAGRAAAEARCPWCSSPELGFARLYAIARDAEGRGEDATAVAAWRAVRAATLATVILETAPARRERADVEIARLEHRIDVAAGSATPAASEERLRVALATSSVPSGIVFVLLALGGGIFLAGAVRFARAKSFGRVDLATALVGGAVAALGLIAF